MRNKLSLIIKYGLQKLVFNKKIPFLFGIVITDKCNLSCFYCESKNSGRYHFPFELAQNTLLEAYRRGHRFLYFTGGEPMLWEDKQHRIDELIKFARSLGFIEVFVYTNGTLPLVNDECSYVVTIDGPKEIHNQIRSNSYDLILKNVRNAVNRTVFATITLTKANVEYLNQFIQEVTKTNLFKGITFNLLTHWPKIVNEYGFLDDEKKELMDNIWQLKKMGYPITLSRAGYHAIKNNNWTRPIPQIELGTIDKVFTCCRDVDNRAICENCGYVTCAEISQILAFKPSALWQAYTWWRDAGLGL